MEGLSKEFLEKLVVEEKTLQKIKDRIDQELKLLVEEIAKRYTK